MAPLLLAFALPIAIALLAFASAVPSPGANATPELLVEFIIWALLASTSIGNIA